jgi:hypothetical protein
MAEAGAAMRRHDDQVRFRRFRDLDDFAVWDTHDDLATDLDRGLWGLPQHLCEVKTRLALQIVNEALYQHSCHQPQSRHVRT